MINRPYWFNRVQAAWQKRPIVWLAGVRRVGKTTLARMIPDTIYLNCDLPSDTRRLEDPELFFRALPQSSIVVLDEIHRLADPSRVLKIAADTFPGLRILATGSSTLAATRKFKDALTGRKIVLNLSPVLWTEIVADFGILDIERRLINGGLPEFLLSPVKDPALFSEWMDSFYARDIQELFAVRERAGFLNLFRLMLRQSGGLADYSALSRECDISRTTVKAYLEAMSIAYALIPLPPFHGGGRREIIRRPKVYGFDTGFVTYARGWTEIRSDDCGILWEHLVLDILRAATGGEGLQYWRDKSGRELDFVLRRGRDVDVFECKLNPDRFEPDCLSVFRMSYPDGRNYLICPDVKVPYERRVNGLTVKIVDGPALEAGLRIGPE
jgi:predicted AAA+ superfamily ATPase